MVLVIANWKMNVVNNIEKLAMQDGVEVVICPPFTHLSTIKKAANMFLGGQDVTAVSSNKGAFTGEISAEMLSSLGCDYCIVGHSERRKNFGDNNANIAKKISYLHEYNITPIICIGEGVNVRNDNQVFEFLKRELDELTIFAPSKNMIIAYEPIWSIGTGKAASLAEIDEVSSFINEYCLKEIESKVKIVYGGSVDAHIASDILRLKKISGVLVGGACLDIAEFNNIIEMVKKT